MNLALSSYKQLASSPPTHLNVSFEIKKKIENIFYHYQAYGRESNNDDRLIFQTNIDASKILKGVRGNAIISLLADAILKKFDFNLNFPIEVVRFSINLQLKSIFLN